jgi:hypothetical protein
MFCAVCWLLSVFCSSASSTGACAPRSPATPKGLRQKLEHLLLLIQCVLERGEALVELSIRLTQERRDLVQGCLNLDLNALQRR